MIDPDIITMARDMVTDGESVEITTASLAAILRAYDDAVKRHREANDRWAAMYRTEVLKRRAIRATIDLLPAITVEGTLYLKSADVYEALAAPARETGGGE